MPSHDGDGLRLRRPGIGPLGQAWRWCGLKKLDFLANAFRSPHAARAHLYSASCTAAFAAICLQSSMSCLAKHVRERYCVAAAAPRHKKTLFINKANRGESICRHLQRANWSSKNACINRWIEASARVRCLVHLFNSGVGVLPLKQNRANTVQQSVKLEIIPELQMYLYQYIYISTTCPYVGARKPLSFWHALFSPRLWGTPASPHGTRTDSPATSWRQRAPSPSPVMQPDALKLQFVANHQPTAAGAFILTLSPGHPVTAAAMITRLRDTHSTMEKT